jgi:hypothetical protein
MGVLARPEGLEPPTRCLEGSRSVQLSYGRGSDAERLPASAVHHTTDGVERLSMERPTGLEPATISLEG